ncbi:hypothetical protein LIR33_20680 [Flavonifractor plautii]|uniref:type II secretion system F family protein n=1 Tax=Flavonifractor plautii TaxID=292800 RepID=UPI001D018CD2|nr:hypothetical protein [Flavonifractor plautii]MCB5780845.1 hypothetical protein [Flavonifractor plautii]
MLGEKRSQSLFAPKASAEKAAATHITTGPDGRKKELPLYFGPDCPVSGNMGQNQHEAGVGEPQPADEPLRHAPADDGTGVEADPTDSVNMAEDLPRRSLNTESAGGYRAHSLFFTPENEGQDFNTVLQDVQEYISGKYSALITEGGDEDAKAQIKRYITKYVQDRRIAVKGYSGDQLVDALYTEMAEFGLLTKYIFGTGIEEINVNSWRDIITTAYLRNEDIQTAVEENIDYLNPPVRSVFVEFLTRIKLVDPDVDAALQDMGTKIDNAVFREWVAALLTCRHDRGLKTILTPIVAKLSDMRIVNGELENLVFEPRKEFITMQVLVIGNIPLLYWLNQDWYDVLMHTPLGQALLAAIAAVMFISTAAVIKLTQPIEYRR